LGFASDLLLSPSFRLNQVVFAPSSGYLNYPISSLPDFDVHFFPLACGGLLARPPWWRISAGVKISLFLPSVFFFFSVFGGGSSLCPLQLGYSGLELF